MNERIRELAVKAQVEHCVSHVRLQEFAELIVRECVEVVKWTPSQFPNDEYVKNIKEHFRVE